MQTSTTTRERLGSYSEASRVRLALPELSPRMRTGSRDLTGAQSTCGRRRVQLCIPRLLKKLKILVFCTQ